MPSKKILAVLTMTILPVFAGLALADLVELDRPVTYKVRLCESKTTKPLSGEDARQRWSDCATPIADVPVRFKAGEVIAGPVETDADGIALLGPVESNGVTEFKIQVACTTHSCLTYNVHPDLIREGENLLLYYTTPNAERSATPALPDLPAGILSAEEIAALDGLAGIDTEISLEFQGTALSSLVDVLGKYASFTAEYRNGADSLYVNESLERQSVKRVLVYIANKYDLAYESPSKNQLVVSRRNVE